MDAHNTMPSSARLQGPRHHSQGPQTCLVQRAHASTAGHPPSDDTDCCRLPSDCSASGAGRICSRLPSPVGGRRCSKKYTACWPRFKAHSWCWHAPVAPVAPVATSHSGYDHESIIKHQTRWEGGEGCGCYFAFYVPWHSADSPQVAPRRSARECPPDAPAA